METTSLHPAPLVVPPRSRWRRRSLLAGAVLFFIAGAWYWSRQLNHAERQLVGDWLTINHYDDGSTCARNWTFRADRTCHIVNIYQYAATPQRAGYREVDVTEATWQLRQGQLMVDPQRPLAKRLNRQGAMIFHRVRNGLLGTKQRVIDGELSTGRFRQSSDMTFTITWWNPDTQSDSSTQDWTRRTSSALVEPPPAGTPERQN